MLSFYIIRVFILLILSVLVLNKDSQTKPRNNSDFDTYCDRLLETPFYHHNLVVGVKWRVYYIWNSEEDTCIDVTFREINPLLINHVRSQMQRFLKTQPDWMDAELYVTMSGYRHVLLIAEKEGAPGSFRQVPHAVNEFIRINSTKAVLYRMALNLFFDGHYLIMADCGSGIVFLLADKSEAPDWNEIRTVVLGFDFGYGSSTCIQNWDTLNFLN